MKLSKGKIYRTESTGLYTADILEPTLEAEPSFEWKGSKIPMSLFFQVATFFREVYKLYGSEAMVRLYHHATLGWKAWAYPQRVSAASVSEIEDDFAAKQRGEIGAGYELVSTMHSHGGMSAFASGQDQLDEKTKNGLHVTLGSFDKDVLTIDIRATFQKISYKNTSGWFQGRDDLSDTLNQQIIEWDLCRPRVIAYPDEWLSNVFVFDWKALPSNLTAISRRALPTASPGSGARDNAFAAMERVIDAFHTDGITADDIDILDSLVDPIFNQLDFGVPVEHISSVVQRLADAFRQEYPELSNQEFDRLEYDRQLESDKMPF